MILASEDIASDLESAAGPKWALYSAQQQLLCTARSVQWAYPIRGFYQGPRTLISKGRLSFLIYSFSSVSLPASLLSQVWYFLGEF